MSDLSKLTKFANKDFRDGYLQTAVRGGIAYQIQALREKLGLTQKAFAEKLGKKQSVVSRLESHEYGKVSVQTLLEIACSLDVALLVRFVSYPEFLNRAKQMSEAALKPPTIFESLDSQNELSHQSTASVQYASLQADIGPAMQNAVSESDWSSLQLLVGGISPKPSRQNQTTLMTPAIQGQALAYSANDNRSQAMGAFLGSTAR